MESELAHLETSDTDELNAEVGDDEPIAGKKKGEDEDGIIAVLQG